MKELNVVAAIIKENKKILATKRGYGGFINLWEFPGGKIEKNETKEEALIREINEELNIIVNIEKFALDLACQYPDFYLYMYCYECNIKEGTIKLTEHKDARWLSKNELDSVKWIPADIKIINYLKNKKW
ncbi:MAG: (deoxy)nucleoside triphosphate pyrophosphohydrolase [Methanobrevibacter sp.]|jgi:8-oxo-dGTP diphosphatase|nr:(deoxy)nucleoside triphosphate pyrophosphohydrolase [Methanobrevibacter sp.]